MSTTIIAQSSLDNQVHDVCWPEPAHRFDDYKDAPLTRLQFILDATVIGTTDRPSQQQIHSALLNRDRFYREVRDSEDNEVQTLRELGGGWAADLDYLCNPWEWFGPPLEGDEPDIPTTEDAELRDAIIDAQAWAIANPDFREETVDEIIADLRATRDEAPSAPSITGSQSEQSVVELFCGIKTLCARPAGEALHGIYG